MIPNSYWIDEYVSRECDWVVDGLIGPYINAISGQPKVGKSTLVTQIVLAVVNQTPLLGKSIKSKSNKVAWMGYDAGWDSELKSRCGDNAKNCILLQPGLRSLNLNDWDALGRKFQELDIGLLVIDHLYGFAGHINLNESQEAYKVINCLNQINIGYEIPIILIAQATKLNYTGGMAHSNLLKSAPRVLIEMSGTGKTGKRTLQINGNEIASEKLSIVLSQDQVEITNSPIESTSKQERDYKANLERAKLFFKSANEEELQSLSAAAPVLVRLGESQNASSARKMLERMRDKKLISDSTGSITPGENYFT